MRGSPLRIEQQNFFSRKRSTKATSAIFEASSREETSIRQKPRTDGDAVKSAGDVYFYSGLNRVRVAKLVQALVALDDLAIDPVPSFSASPNHFSERLSFDSKIFFPSDAPQRMRDVKSSPVE